MKYFNPHILKAQTQSRINTKKKKTHIKKTRKQKNDTQVQYSQTAENLR